MYKTFFSPPLFFQKYNIIQLVTIMAVFYFFIDIIQWLHAEIIHNKTFAMWCTLHFLLSSNPYKTYHTCTAHSTHHNHTCAAFLRNQQIFELYKNICNLKKLSKWKQTIYSFRDITLQKFYWQNFSTIKLMFSAFTKTFGLTQSFKYKFFVYKFMISGDYNSI